MIGRLNRVSKRLLRNLPFVACCVITACASAPRHVPRPHGDEAALVPPSLRFTASDGACIPVRVWPSHGRPRAVILALHGFGDSRDAWEWPAPILAGADLAVYAPDQRGFGEAPQRGWWSSTDRMIADAREEAAWLHHMWPDLPLYIMGESMGGAVALRLDETPNPTPVAGTILVSPAIWRFDPASRAFLAALDFLAPAWTLDGSALPVHVVPSDNPAALRRLYFDPLTLHASKLHAVRGLVDLMATARREASQARTPLLVLYGDDDQLVPSGPMDSFWRALPADARLDMIPAGHHLLLRDRHGGRATQDIVSWILRPERWLPSGGDIAASAWMASSH